MRNMDTGVSATAEVIERELFARKVKLRKQHVRALADLCATALQSKSVNTSDWIPVLPRKNCLRKSKETYILRFLSSPLISPLTVMSVLVRDLIAREHGNGSVAVLVLDQSKITDGFECLMLSLRFGNRALPIIWKVVETKGAIGFDIQKELLDEALERIPEVTAVMLAADRFYGTRSLVGYCQEKGWSYRIRLKGNLRFRHDEAEISPAEAHGLGMDSLEDAIFASSDVSTNVGILHEKGHPEPWFIAMDSKPNEYRTLDYGMRWGIECMFSDFKSRGFGVTDTRLKTPARITLLLLILGVGMYFAVSTGMMPDKEAFGLSKKNATDR